MNNRVPLLVAGALLLATSACAGTSSLPTSTPSLTSALRAGAVFAVDKTSILKKLTNDVVIGSTVDPGNGDTGPTAISLVRGTQGHLKSGDLLVCNFADSTGAAGKGTTIELFAPQPQTTPTTFAQSTRLRGCDGAATTAASQVYATGLLAGRAAHFDPDGNFQKSYGKPIAAPFADADAWCGLAYAPEDIYVSDSKTGAIIKMEFYIFSGAQQVKLQQVISGFAVNKGSGWGILAPSGIQYDKRRTGSLCNDTLYIVDGANNTIVSVSNASNLLAKNEIVVQNGGKTFTCKDPKATCATLVHSGSPLNAPVASALLPNGNLIVANTKGGNKLVELTPSGKVLATKLLDRSKTAHIFGLLAVGTTDSDTALYYTDTGTNTLHELTQ